MPLDLLTFDLKLLFGNVVSVEGTRRQCPYSFPDYFVWSEGWSFIEVKVSGSESTVYDVHPSSSWSTSGVFPAVCS